MGKFLLGQVFSLEVMIESGMLLNILFNSKGKQFFP